MPYRVERGVSTRASADPGSPKHDEWVHWHPGDVVAEFPAHVGVEGLLASGAISPADDEGPAPVRRRKERG